ncbi:oxidoreductase [Pseudomonas sp. BN415]|uniref:iron-sulfur cluster-binding protein n=1 Tax=Pseudomonas sp. BN415 TaxID=2567889 RepID=UPI002453DE62|nr:oxidoreductase [Pseudomonas sp. BN415]
MISLTPRRLKLARRQEDGDSTQVLQLVIDHPLDCDLETIPGQFFMLSLPGVGEGPFSYLEMPDSLGNFRALVRSRGRLTSALLSQPEGTVLGYRGPYGVGWPLLIGRHSVLIITLGYGLVSLASYVQEACNWRLPGKLRLLHISNGRASLALDAARAYWHSELGVVELEVPDIATAWFHGAEQQLLADLFAAERPDAVLCCGPEPFMQAAGRLCVAKGVAPESIWLSIMRRMSCGVGLCGNCHFGTTYVCMHGPVLRYDHYWQQMRYCEPHQPWLGEWLY